MRFRHRGSGFIQHQRVGAGFTLIEMMVVVAAIAILATIAIVSAGPIWAKQRDSERISELHRFAERLEQYRAGKGAYVCGDGCANRTDTNGNTDWYSIDCSNNAETLWGDNRPEEENGFLNGGDCCNLQYTIPSTNVAVNHAHGGFPAPVSLNDDASWGLYRHGYAETSLLIDPLEGRLKNGVNYTYCFSTPVGGRGSYALFARLESSDAGAKDGGLTDEWYEIHGGNYPRDGWYPGIPPGNPYCGNDLVEGLEQCDDDNTTSGDGCSEVCVTERCGDGIIQTGLGEVCDGSNFGGQTCASIRGWQYSGTLKCRFQCTSINAAFCTKTPACGDGIRDTGEVCDTMDLGGMTCLTYQPGTYSGGTLGCVNCGAYDDSGCFSAEN